MYSKQSAAIYRYIKWGENILKEFDVSNGVKQSGILSPILFTLSFYLDLLLFELKDNGLG